MLIDPRRPIGIAILVVAISACSPVDPSFGEAVKYNQAIQTINPDPVYPPGSAKPGDSGTRAAAAAKAYRTGTVKPVEKISDLDPSFETFNRQPPVGVSVSPVLKK